MRKISLLLAALLALFTALPAQAQVQFTQGNSPISRPGGTFYATAYGTWSGRVLSGNTTTGSGTSIVVTIPNALQDNTVWGPQILFNTLLLNPILVNDNNAETVTPTSVSVAPCPAGNVGVGGSGNSCATITGTFNNTHGQDAIVASGSFGLGEAYSAALSVGGGVVVVDQAWAAAGGTSAMITALLPYQGVAIADYRQAAAPETWTLVGGATSFTAPVALTSATVGDALAATSAKATGGFYTNANAYHVCYAPVDLMGQEGACSADYSFTPATGSTNQIGFTTPPALTGAVGWVPYIGLTNGGSTTLVYKVPLAAQPTVTGAYPVSNGVCTLTTLETITPACAITNTKYGQTGSQAVVSAITLSTSPISPQLTTTSSTTVYVPNPGGRTSYVFAPGNRLGITGTVGASLPFTIGAAAATVVPNVIGTINLAPGFMNFVGKTIEVCGFATTTATAATIEDIQLQWDSTGQNTAGKGVALVDLTATTTLATTGHISFCADLQTTVASASATGGSINVVGGYETVSGVTIAGTNAAGSNTITGATGSLNLASDARINVIYLHTTATDGAGWTLQGLTVKELN